MEENRKFKRTTVTSALPYANGGVHIGHLAGVYVPADIYVRYLRLKGEEVMFIGGSDEHGVPVTMRARKEGITPQDVVDRYHKMIKDSFEQFGISCGGPLSQDDQGLFRAVRYFLRRVFTDHFEDTPQVCQRLLPQTL